VGLLKHPYPGFSGIIYPGFSSDPRKHWMKNIFRRVQNRPRLSRLAVLACGLTTETGCTAAAPPPNRRGRRAAWRASGPSPLESSASVASLPVATRLPRRFALRAVAAPPDAETLRDTEGHGNARPSAVCGDGRRQAAQTASAKSNSSCPGGFSAGLRGRPVMLRSLSSPISERRFARSGCVLRLSSAQLSRMAFTMHLKRGDARRRRDVSPHAAFQRHSVSRSVPCFAPGRTRWSRRGGGDASKAAPASRRQDRNSACMRGLRTQSATPRRSGEAARPGANFRGPARRAKPPAVLARRFSVGSPPFQRL